MTATQEHALIQLPAPPLSLLPLPIPAAAPSLAPASSAEPEEKQPAVSRILVIDDMPSIHDDFRKILEPVATEDPEFARLEEAILGAKPSTQRRTAFTVDGAQSGEDGLALVQKALAEQNPYLVAFVDVRMPSGWDGIETTARIRQVDPDIQIVICTAYSDYSWDQMIERLGLSDGLLILKKPFDTVEVLQLAETLNQKWKLARQAKLRVADLDRMVNQRTHELRRANEHLAKEIAERSRAQTRLSVFSNLACRLSAARSAKDAGQIIIDTADQLLGWDACLIDLYSPESDTLTHVLHVDIINGARTETTPDYAQRPPSPLARRTIREGAILVHNKDPHLRQPDGHRFGDTARASATIMYVPIRDGTSVTGVLSIQSYTPKAYDQRSLETLQTLADHCGGAVDRIRNEEALRKMQEQLRQSQKLEAIGQLAGGVAHDFNNLLAVIRGNADLAKMLGDGLGTDIDECLGQIIGASERAANLTRQLLAFSRKQMMQSRAACLSDVIVSFTKMLRRIIGEHIDFKCDFKPGLPAVKVDVGMIEQVLANLVVNARDAMSDGGQLLISTEEITFAPGQPQSHPEARAGHFVCLLVKDTGSGIAAEHVAHIFEPFFTTKEMGKGTGLGLATVYGIVKQHQGWIEVSSEPGQGSTFIIYLPALEETAPNPQRKTAAESQPGGGDETILLVEDEQDVRAVTKSVLQRSGYKVIEASSGKEALKVVEDGKSSIDLLLTDVLMPDGISGRKLAEDLRQKLPDLKMVFVSGYSGDIMGPDTEHLRQANSYFLQKPCSPRDMLGAVRRCMDGLPPVESNKLVSNEKV
jgi:signal transduction histidine kinase/DNA-binding NtrC family response regulator